MITGTGSIYVEWHMSNRVVMNKISILFVVILLFCSIGNYSYADTDAEAAEKEDTKQTDMSYSPPLPDLSGMEDRLSPENPQQPSSYSLNPIYKLSNAVVKDAPTSSSYSLNPVYELSDAIVKDWDGNATVSLSLSQKRRQIIKAVIDFVISFPFPILVITIITYYLISRKIKESVVLILLTTVVSYFAWMILAVTILDYIPSWFNDIDIQISYIIGILLQVLIVNFVSRLYLKFNKSNSNKPL